MKLMTFVFDRWGVPALLSGIAFLLGLALLYNDLEEGDQTRSPREALENTIHKGSTAANLYLAGIAGLTTSLVMIGLRVLLGIGSAIYRRLS